MGLQKAFGAARRAIAPRCGVCAYLLAQVYSEHAVIGVKGRLTRGVVACGVPIGRKLCITEGGGALLHNHTRAIRNGWGAHMCMRNTWYIFCNT